MTKKCKILFAFILIFSCKESIPDPEQVTLINPENNNTCLFSNSNANSGDVEFSWTEAKHTDNYDLIIENQLTDLKNSRTINQTFARVKLERGAPYSWYVVSKSESTENIALSETRNFYLEGPSQLTHIPFPAKLISPLNESIINSTESSVSSLGFNLISALRNFVVKKFCTLWISSGCIFYFFFFIK